MAVIGHHIRCEKYMLVASLTKKPATPKTRALSILLPVFAPRQLLNIISMYGLYTTKGTTSDAAIAVLSSSICS